METTKTNVNDPISYEAYKGELKKLIDRIKETNEVNYATELMLYCLLCDAYYKTNLNS